MDHLLCHADAVDLSSAPQLAFSQWPSLLVICMCIILFHSVPEACLIEPLLQFGLPSVALPPSLAQGKTALVPSFGRQPRGQGE